MCIGAASCFFTALRRQGDVRFTPKADMCCAVDNVRFGPIADIRQVPGWPKVQLKSLSRQFDDERNRSAWG